MNRKFVAAALLCVVLYSCSSSSSNVVGSGGGSPIIPLFIGNVWVMDTTIYDASGAPHAGGEDSIKVHSSTISPKDGSTYFDLGYFWVMAASDGLYSSAPPSFYNAYLYFKYPASPGDEFRHHTDVIPMPFPVSKKPDSVATLFANYVVLTNSAQISVPAGTFNCYEYVTNWNEAHGGGTYQRDVIYFAPGTGFVRTEHYSILGTDVSSLRLRTQVNLKAVKLLH